MKYQTMRIDHLNHLYIEASAGEVRFTVNGGALVVEPVLSEKKPRTKVGYEQLGFHKCHEAMFKHEMEEKLYRTSHDGFVVVSMNDIVDNWQSDLYRRIETPMTEREAFVEAAIHELESGMSDRDYAKALFDSGKFKLVN
ncbi:hypothetical protein NVP1047O_69 [Vibrio phage 1.047.O._10N.286.55.F2]|nr:hypothetical protein NVP1047O_69 [Vibrio phage 1.047.O._10N.286.55.F2]